MTLMKQNNNAPIKFRVGDSLQPCNRPEQPFSEPVCRFLADLSKALLHSQLAKQYSDVISFAFFCRAANLDKLKKDYLAQNSALRRGLGAVFHIAPANVPTNFAYSLAAALLAGNANIVRLPQREFLQSEIICEAIEQILSSTEHEALREMITIISYDRNDAITEEISAFANGRIIWGGDATIKAIRQIPLTPRGVEIAFADRYSLALIDSDALLEHPEQAEQLAADFYNDAYLMGQAACSSPHLVLWLGQDSQAAGDIFWPQLAEVAKRKFSLTPVDVVDKYTAFIEDLMMKPELESYRNFDNYLYTLRLKQLPNEIHKLRGQAGYFYEVNIATIDEIAELADEKVQTLTYFGVGQEQFRQLLQNNRFAGIDRIVPVGRALDFSLTWDGYDLIRGLSRALDIY